MVCDQVRAKAFDWWAASDVFRGKLLGALARLGASWGVLGGLWGGFGVSWGVLGASWGVLEASWGVFGASWGVFGTSWVRVVAFYKI